MTTQEAKQFDVLKQQVRTARAKALEAGLGLQRAQELNAKLQWEKQQAELTFQEAAQWWLGDGA